ncbi:hypothetical protein ACO0LG_20930 [Undibacterium sp. Ji42W]|uniref:hypothetical protein n=1 Tax=Undibacterium sp. Ji42W TaxID=3413039 RepID=UPI003BF06677
MESIAHILPKFIKFQAKAAKKLQFDVLFLWHAEDWFLQSAIVGKDDIHVTHIPEFKCFVTN